MARAESAEFDDGGSAKVIELGTRLRKGVEVE